MSAELHRLSSLVEILRWRADRHGGRRAFTFLREGEEEEARLTYAQLDAQARAVAQLLISLGAAGERVLLVYPAGLEFAAAFLGCLYAGAVAVPVPVPRSRRNVQRLEAIAANAEPAWGLSSAATLEKLRPLLPGTGLAALPFFSSDELAPAAAGVSPLPAADDLAFLQYTSGSTGQPKGICLSHGQLLANQRLMQAALGQTEASRFVSWLPLFHDMGLIGHLLQTVYLGAEAVLMAPEAFLVKPVRWLQALSRYGGEMSGGPNFAYELCVRRVTVEQRATLDLSRWQGAFNGAEPVRAATLARFAEAFAPCGFRPEAFFPCYGLAEATLFVTGGQRSCAPKTLSLAGHPHPLVSCGTPPANTQVVVADPETGEPRAAGECGEIWVAGPQVASGYWRDATASRQTFGARLPDGKGPFLRTGDLGLLQGGELYISGRCKELIIIAGRNLFPADLEATVEAAHPVVRLAGVAAFSVEGECEEQLVILAEVERHRRSEVEWHAVRQAIQASLAKEHGLRAADLVLLPPASLPKTTSGKLRRAACRQAYQAGELRAWPMHQPPVQTVTA